MHMSHTVISSNGALVTKKGTGQTAHKVQSDQGLCLSHQLSMELTLSTELTTTSLMTLIQEKDNLNR